VSLRLWLDQKTSKEINWFFGNATCIATSIATIANYLQEFDAARLAKFLLIHDHRRFLRRIWFSSFGAVVSTFVGQVVGAQVGGLVWRPGYLKIKGAASRLRCTSVSL
jgi:hypothetical protein